jgi:hypothetical protein
MKHSARVSLLSVIILFLINTAGISQEDIRKMILADGTAVKIFPDGKMELRFLPDKQIQEVAISKTGEVTTKYQEEPPASSEQPDKEVSGAGKTLPGAVFFSYDPKQMDENSRKSFLKARTDYFEYFSAGYRHRQRVFQWQLASSKIIFVVVVLLVFSGIVFAAIQFYAGLKKVTGDKEQVTVTTFEAGSTGLKVSSPVLGLIILVISLAFFYLYLVYIYPIEEIF